MSETQPSVDFLILADRAESLNGKLYLMGGGWDVLSPPNAQTAMNFSCALGILVPWHATNSDQHCRLRLENADGGEVFAMTVNFRCGRPPHLEQGAIQRVIMAIPVAVAFPTSGVYVLTAAIGEDERRARFEVRLQHAQA